MPKELPQVTGDPEVCPQSAPAICPLCCRELDEDNILKAHYYLPKRWWVIEHLKRENGAWKQWCSQAGYQVTFKGIKTP